MIELVLPAGVAGAESFGPHRAAPLLPAERQATATAGPHRRAEFAAGRARAREAMGRLGLRGQPVPADPVVGPRWPEGLVGSITHCPGYSASAVGFGDDLLGLGIDAEPHRPALPEVLQRIATPEERAQESELRRTLPVVPWSRLLFSAKEATYKAWFPVHRRGLRFADVTVTFAPRGRTFVARVGPPGGSGQEAGDELQGRWCAGRLLLTCAVLARR